MTQANSTILPGHAIGIQLFNPEDQAVLYIDNDPHKHTLHCEVINISDRIIEINAHKDNVGNILTKEVAGPDLYHFAIRFRRGLLQTDANGKIELNAEVNLGKKDWCISEVITDTNGATIYFLYGGEEKISLNKEGILRLSLNGVQASPVSGARTTRVELLFNDINYESDAQLLNGERIHLLNVVNHMGHRIAPLLFNWVGDHRLLNNNEEQTIRLRMINTQRNHPLRLSQDKLKPTKIIFETTDNHIQIKQITLVKNEACDQLDFGVKKEPYLLSHDEANHRWTFSEEEWMITEVGKGGCIEFDVCFTPGSNSDTYFLSIHYENIPGYWDNSITLPLLVSPIVFKGNNVGIGMEPEDDATLTVGVKKQYGTGLKVKGRMHSDSKDGGLWLDDEKKAFIGNTIKNVGIWLTNLGKYVFNVHKESGKVHIGHDESFVPKYDLDVKGDINASGKFKENGHDVMPAGAIIMWGGEKAPDGWALCDGGEYEFKDRTKRKTPDLRERFVVGKGNNPSLKKTKGLQLNDTGGNEENQLVIPEHRTNLDGDHVHTFKVPVGFIRSFRGVAAGDTIQKPTGIHDPSRILQTEAYEGYTSDVGKYKGEHLHIIPKQEVNYGDATDHLPPYYTLAFIIKL